MPSIFLSHTSCDKPFVEKLARDLKRIGVNVWFDKWEIKVGESITWKIEQGIRENEYLGIVLSPEALNSEWVKSELGSAWAKQMRIRKVIVLPILYRDCDVPLFLADRRYADFRNDYQNGFKELAGALGISETETISLENWRRFAKSRSGDWQKFRKLEFERLVTLLVKRAKEYNWSSWVGGSRLPFSITLRALIDRDRHASVSLRLDGRSLAYMATLADVWNPNHLRASDFDIYVGNTINECEEFVWRIMEDFRREHGAPPGKSSHNVYRFLSKSKTFDLAIKMAKELGNEFTWYKGDEPL